MFPRDEAKHEDGQGGYLDRKEQLMTGTTLQHDLESAYRTLLVRRRRRRRVARLGSLGGAAGLLLAGAALGASALLGWPAPAHVQEEIAAVDTGMPADLRLNPDVAHARAVASIGTTTLYAADLRGGGSCSELVTAGDRGRGARCTTGAELAGRPIDLTVPSDADPAPDTPIALGGRINASNGTNLEVVYVDGSSDPIPFGEDRYFVFEVPALKLATVHAAGLELVARSEEGSVIARASLPADWDDPAAPDENAPIYVSTRSDASDFTKVFGLEGHVGAAGATSLELRYDDGAVVSIPIQPNGDYAYVLPIERTDDFMHPQMLIARNANGDVVASTSVAAVAYWRAAGS
jgi:hypothetical protein